MSHTIASETPSAMYRLMTDFENFDGACDPAFDSDSDELEREFAELRLLLASE